MRASLRANPTPTPTENASLRVNLTVPPELMRAIERGEAKWSVSIGPVTVQPGPVYQPHDSNYQPPPVAPRRAAPIADRPVRASSGTIQSHFYGLMRNGALLQQSDYRLAARGLLIPSGGLCATTSAVNVLHAAFSHLGRDTRAFHSSDGIVAELVGQAWQQLSKDARMGLDFPSLGIVINDVANRLDAGVGVHAERSYLWRRQGGADVGELKGDADTLALLAVTTSPTSSHAISVIDVDEGRQTITYSDPNYPNQANERRYFTNYNGELQIDGFNGFGVVNDVLKIRTRAFNSSSSNRWKDYEGKRVYITGQDGRRSLTTIDRVDGPSPEYPDGRVVQYSYFFGSGGGGTWPVDQIRRIEEVEPPAAQRIKGFEKYVGEKVRVRFTEPYLQDRYGGEKFLVESMVRERDKDHHPFGGLKVKSATQEWGTKGVVPFEVIESIELADARVDARRTNTAAPTGGAKAPRKRKIV